jgi:hypothetical protein
LYVFALSAAAAAAASDSCFAFQVTTIPTIGFNVETVE